MSVNRKLSARNEYRCDICGHVGIWADGFGYYGSLLHAETCPDDLPHACSDKCAKALAIKVESGEFVLPKLKHGEYYSTKVADGKGYGAFSTLMNTLQKDTHQ